MGRRGTHNREAMAAAKVRVLVLLRQQLADCGWTQGKLPHGICITLARQYDIAPATVSGWWAGACRRREKQ